MKKITFVVLFVLSLIVGVTTTASANTQTTFSEKVWTIEMNLHVLNTAENLSKVKLINQANQQEVSAVVEVNANNTKVIEVYPTTNFAFGNYSIVVEEGFQSKTGFTLTQSVSKDFEVNKIVDVSSVNGVWKTAYVYKQIPFAIEVDFKDGLATMELEDLQNNRKYTAEEAYTVEQGYMEMVVTGLDALNLTGDIRFYSDKEFKLVTKGGKFAYYHRIN